MHPPFSSIGTQAIGLGCLATSLRTHGYEVEILNCQTEPRRSIPLPPELSYLRDFYPVSYRFPFRLYDGFYHFGMRWDEIREKMEDSKADYDTIVETNEKNNIVIYRAIP